MKAEAAPIEKSNRNSKSLRHKGLAVTVAAGVLLSGCAAPVIGAMTLAEVATIAGMVSTFMSGRDLTEHALSAATGEDCRLLESLLRPERAICEAKGSPATRSDFQGVIALLDGEGNTAFAQADIEVRRATDPVALGFAPINRRVAVDGFSLALVEDPTTNRRGTRVSFGMLQASYGQSWSYELTTRRNGSQVASTPTPGRNARGTQLAQAAPTALPAARSDGAIIQPQPVTN